MKSIRRTEIGITKRQSDVSQQEESPEVIIDWFKSVLGKGILKKIKPKGTKKVQFHEDVEDKDNVSRNVQSSRRKHGRKHSKQVSNNEKVEIIDLGSDEEDKDDDSNLKKQIDSHKKIIIMTV